MNKRLDFFFSQRLPSAHRRACRIDAVKHVNAQGHAHNQVHGVARYGNGEETIESVYRSESCQTTTPKPILPYTHAVTRLVVRQELGCEADNPPKKILTLTAAKSTCNGFGEQLLSKPS